MPTRDLRAEWCRPKYHYDNNKTLSCCVKRVGILNVFELYIMIYSIHWADKIDRQGASPYSNFLASQAVGWSHKNQGTTAFRTQDTTVSTRLAIIPFPSVNLH